MEYDTDKVSSEPSRITVYKACTANDILEQIPVDSRAFETIQKIIDLGKGDKFINELTVTYTDGISADELYRILEAGDEAFELCGLNADGSEAEWKPEEPEDELDENVELLTNSALEGGFDRMHGFPTIVYTINEDNPDWEEKFDAIQNVVYDASRNIECYDVHLEGGFHSPEGWEEVQLAVDPCFDCDEDGCEEDKAAVMDLIERLVTKYGFKELDFNNVEADTAVRPEGEIYVFDGDVDELKNELASTHDFEDPSEIGDYLEDKGFNVVPTDNGHGFEAWYADPENQSAEYLKFQTSQDWDPVYGPVCRLNESTFRVVHPKKLKKSSNG